MSQAMKAIKDEQCCECRRKAKGLVYTHQGVRYYCKRCLHNYMKAKETEPEMAEANTA
jgi:hypothetical protein